ncbi:pyruvate decarboxylase [Elizabethkingia meningoseptica]|uniref:pyruvate decarboxylase n=1 Tax=Elizabethkingia meningoseptica TaxID=238 RepID=UPI0023B1B507|nr:pyruvate decarboxylase [Elizabethkingia meningoseptica]MDE5526412.1 pyruvate decarboxylase [Elizabethkingia meningoseptica]
MKKVLLFGTLAIITTGLLVGCANFGDSLHYVNNDVKLGKIAKIVYLTPEIYPDFEGLEEPTYQAFFSAATDKLYDLGDIKLSKIDTPMPYDTIDVPVLKTLCNNNMADLIVVPKVKYFKVGLGKYVLSNQVVVSMKAYNKMGDFVMEVAYDTYSGNGRLIGSAENSVKIGTSGAIQKMFKEFRKRKMLGVHIS